MYLFLKWESLQLHSKISIQFDCSTEYGIAQLGPYVVHFICRDSTNVERFICRDSPNVVHLICRDSPYVVHLKRSDSPYVVHLKHRDCTNVVLNVEEALNSSILVVQKAAAPKTGVEFRQGSNGTITSSLATSYDV